MRRAIITWTIVFAGLALVAIGVVAALNATVYSAAGFVRGYLAALERGDADAALAMDGVAVPADASPALLARDALGAVGDIRLEFERETRAGTHQLTFSWTADGEPGTTTFEVAQSGARFGLFPTWRFESNPVATLTVVSPHDERVDVNGVRVTAPEVSTGFAVFAPGSYVVGHESEFLRAQPVTITVAEPRERSEVVLEIAARAEFVDLMQERIDDYLDTECVTQPSLVPAGCPFERPVDDRVTSTPEWSMVEYPAVAIAPGGERGQWFVREAGGVAHLRVDIQRLFDGTLETIDEDVPFTARYELDISPDGEVALTVL